MNPLTDPPVDSPAPTGPTLHRSLRFQTSSDPSASTHPEMVPATSVPSSPQPSPPPAQPEHSPIPSASSPTMDPTNPPKANNPPSPVLQDIPTTTNDDLMQAISTLIHHDSVGEANREEERKAEREERKAEREEHMAQQAAFRAAAPSSKSKSKGPETPIITFNGDFQSFESFLLQWDDYLRYYRDASMDDHDMISHASSFLEGAAFLWYRRASLTTNNWNDNYQEFRTALISRFRADDDGDDAVRQWEYGIPWPGSTRLFYEIFNEIRGRIGPVSEKVAKYKFFDHLPSTYSDRLLFGHSHYASVEDIFVAAQQLEKADKHALFKQQHIDRLRSTQPNPKVFSRDSLRESPTIHYTSSLVDADDTDRDKLSRTRPRRHDRQQ